MKIDYNSQQFKWAKEIMEERQTKIFDINWNKFKTKEEIEEFIDGLQDSQLRQIIHYHYIKGYSWVKTAGLVNNKESAVKMRVKRYFDKNM